MGTKWRRNSVLTLMIIVAAFALAIAPISNTDWPWFQIFPRLRVGILLFATFKARYAGERAGAWWFGFAAVGWALLILSLAIPNSIIGTRWEVGVWLTQQTFPIPPTRSGMSVDQWYMLGWTIDYCLAITISILGGFLSLAMARGADSRQRGS